MPVLILRYLLLALIFVLQAPGVNWNNQRPDLKEDLAHLVHMIMRRICGEASAVSPISGANPINLSKQKFDQNEFTLPFLNYSTGIHALYSGID